MKALTQYNDLSGSISVDFQILKSSPPIDNFQRFEELFNINTDKLKMVGLVIYGIKMRDIGLICIDKSRTAVNEKKIVKISISVSENFLSKHFSELQIILVENLKNYDSEIESLEAIETVSINDFCN